MVWLSGLLPYQQCAEVFERIGKVLVGASSNWRQTQQHGQRLQEQVEHQRAQVSVERVTLPLTDHPEQKGMSLDGGMVNIRGEGWQEMKVGTVFDVQQRLERDPRTQEWTERPPVEGHPRGEYRLHSRLGRDDRLWPSFVATGGGPRCSRCCQVQRYGGWGGV
jgi:hypothetical protein